MAEFYPLARCCECGGLMECVSHGQRHNTVWREYECGCGGKRSGKFNAQDPSVSEFMDGRPLDPRQDDLTLWPIDEVRDLEGDAVLVVRKMPDPDPHPKGKA